jgi:ribosomal protein L29
MTKIIKNNELMGLSIDELEKSLLVYKKSLFEVRFNKFLTEKGDTSLAKKHKKSVARIKTKINQIKPSVN